MKIKNLLIIGLGSLCFFGAIWWEKNAMSLSAFPESKVTEKPLVADNSVGDRETQAEKLYSEGRFGEAIALLEQLNNNYTAQGDRLGQARVARNLALVYQQTGDLSKAQSAITQSLNLLEKQANSRERQQLFAQILEVQGLLQLAIGQTETALATWEKATSNYQEIGDFAGVSRNQINQSQALQRMGLYRQAIKALDASNVTWQQQPDSLIKVKGLQSLGDALRVVGELDRSQKVLTQGLAIAQRLKVDDARAAMFLSLGETARLEQELPTALDYYQKAVQITTSPYIKTQAMLNHLNVLVTQKQGEKALELVRKIKDNLTQLPLSRQAINTRINLARRLMQLRKDSQVTKAEALRRVQQLFLQDSQFFHPYFWSAFVLVGNWL
jgi:tetratricopeptide (TPR) repeat protein